MSVEWEQVGRGISNGSYNLLLGAGISADSVSTSSNLTYQGPLPTAGKFQNDLAAILPGIRSNASINRLFRALTDDQIAEHVTARFLDPKPGLTVRAIPKFRWRRIFTLNIDNALE